MGRRGGGGCHGKGEKGSHKEKTSQLQSDKGPSCSDLGLLRSGKLRLLSPRGPCRSSEQIETAPVRWPFVFIHCPVCCCFLFTGLAVSAGSKFSFPYLFHAGLSFHQKRGVCLCIGFLPASAYQRMRASVGITMPKSGQERSITRD